MGLGEHPAGAAQRGAPKVSVVYFGNEWFAENRTSSHHIARKLAARANLLYVDSPGMRPPSGSKRDLGRIFRKLWQAVQPPQWVEPGLWHCTVPQLPWARLPGVRRLNRLFGAWAVRRALRIAGMRDPLLWFHVPHPAFMMDAVPHRAVVYYCIDDYAAMPGVDVDYISQCDRALTERADLVFVAPPALVEGKLAINPSTSYSPHGVDVDLFGRAQSPATVVPAPAAALRGPVIGYFGLIAAWTDVDLLLAIARAKPEWTLLLIGFASADVSQLAAMPNVVMVGPQPYESLPSWAKAFDVAIMPYRQNQMVANNNPLKLREYLATGKPVVSTPTAEVYRFGDLVEVATEPGDFIAALERALMDGSSERCSARMVAVSGMSWEARVDETWAKVTKALSAGA